MSKDDKIAQLEIDNEALRLENANLKKLIFGSKKETYKTEQVDPKQGNLFNQQEPSKEVEDVKEEITYSRKKPSKHKGRNKLPEHLPVREVIIEPEEDTTDMIKIGEQVTETLDYTPASLIVIRTRRIKYARKEVTDNEDQIKIIIAPPPLRPIDKCIAEAGLLSSIIVRKFIDHLPFERQIQAFQRDFYWRPAKSTVNDWFIAVCTLLKPLYEQLEKQLLQSEYIQADESPIKVQDKTKPGKTHQGYQWVFHSLLERIVLFKYHKSRSYQAVKEILENYTGWVQCDGYPVYDKLSVRNEHIKLVGCWVHVRRKYFEAQDSDVQRSKYALDIFSQIYNHEAKCKDIESQNRKSYRLSFVRPLVDQLYRWVEEESIKVLPKSPIGKAMQYTLQQKSKLAACFEDGRLELDNNLIENKIRPLALGRKNYLFAGSHAAGQRIAMMYTFFATCKANNVNPQEWLTHTLLNIKETKLPDLYTLMPQHYKL